MAEQVQVTAQVDIQGLEAAMASFQKFTGGMASAQRAMGTIGKGGEQALASGSGVVTPETYDRMRNALDAIKRTETDITKQITERKKSIDDIMGKYPQLSKYLANIEKLGGGPQDLLRALNMMSDSGRKDAYGLSPAEWSNLQRSLTSDGGKLEAQRDKLGQMMPAAESVVASVGRGVEEGQERVFNRWLPRLGTSLISGISTTLSLAGLAGAAAIAGRSYQLAQQYTYREADIGGFLGKRPPRSLLEGGNIGFGTDAMEGLDIAEAFGSAGGDITKGNLGRMAGMGLFFGLGRSGFARMGQQGVGRGAFTDMPQFERFGRMAGGLAESYGLNPAQRNFFLESNKNLIEQMTRWYGGRPLSAEEYLGGVNNLMMGLHGLGLPAGGANVATQAMQAMGQALSPLGKSFEEMAIQGAMLGVKTPPGSSMYLSTQKELSEIMHSPTAFRDAVQRVAKNSGFGTNLQGSQYDSFVALLQSTFPGMKNAMDVMTASGMNPQRILTSSGPLPADLDKQINAGLERTRGASESDVRDADILFAREQIRGFGNDIQQVRKWVQEHMTPEQAAGTSVGISALLDVVKYAGGSALGGLALKGGGGAMAALAAPEIIPIIAAVAGTAFVGKFLYDQLKQSEGAEGPTDIAGKSAQSKQAYKSARADVMDPFTAASNFLAHPDQLISVMEHGIMHLTGALDRNTHSTDKNTDTSSQSNVLPERRRYETARPGGPSR